MKKKTQPTQHKKKRTNLREWMPIVFGSGICVWANGCMRPVSPLSFTVCPFSFTFSSTSGKKNTRKKGWNLKLELDFLVSYMFQCVVSLDKWLLAGKSRVVSRSINQVKFSLLFFFLVRPFRIEFLETHLLTSSTLSRSHLPVRFLWIAIIKFTWNGQTTVRGRSAFFFPFSLLLLVHTNVEIAKGQL